MISLSLKKEFDSMREDVFTKRQNVDKYIVDFENKTIS